MVPEKARILCRGDRFGSHLATSALISQGVSIERFDLTDVDIGKLAKGLPSLQDLQKLDGSAERIALKHRESGHVRG